MVQTLGVPAAQPAYGRPMSVEEWEQLHEGEPGEWLADPTSLCCPTARGDREASTPMIDGREWGRKE